MTRFAKWLVETLMASAVLTIFGGPCAMAQSTAEASFETLAGRATLIALRAGLTSPERITRSEVILLPSPVPLDRASVLSRLSDMPKPVRCVGLEVAGMLAVACWPETRAWQESEVVAGQEARDKELASHLLQTSGSTNILIDGGSESVLFTLPQYREWRRQYRTLFVDQTMTDAPMAARDGKHGARVTFERIQPSNTGGYSRDSADLSN